MIGISFTTMMSQNGGKQLSKINLLRYVTGVKGR